MRRPIVIISFIYILGIAIQYQLDISKSILLFSSVLCMCACLYTVLKYRKLSITFLILIILLIGSLNFQIANKIKGNLSPFYNQDIEITGVVQDASYKNNLELTLQVEEIFTDGIKYVHGEKIIASLRGDYYPPVEIVGKKIEIKGELVKPEENRNPKMFNYRLYLKSKSIYSILYGNIEDIKVKEEEIKFAPIHLANKVRYRIVHNTLRILPDREARVLLGILLGDKDELDEDIYEGFRDVGVAHILAVSGLHVGIIYIFINKLFYKVPIYVRLLSVFSVLSLYIIITDFAPSILRATFMILLLAIGPFFNRRYDLLSSIAFTALILLIVNPILLMNVGFQLSFGAVLSIALLYKPILKKLCFLPSFWAQLIAASTAAQLGIFPLTAYYFNMISPWSPIINIPIVIILGYLLPFGIVTIIIGTFSTLISTVMGEVILMGIRLMIEITNMGSMLPFSGYKVVSPSTLTLIMYYTLLFFFTYDGKLLNSLSINKGKAICLILTFYFTIQTIVSYIPGKLEITFLDVGQGDSIIVRTPRNKILLIDGGGSSYGNHDVGEKVVVPYLLKNGIKKIDFILVSHFHNDHVGGVYKVVEDLNIGEVFIGEQVEDTENYYNLMDICEEKGVKPTTIRGGNLIELENNLKLYILNPHKLLLGSRDDLNNNSVVALLKYNDKKILFTGDIEAEAENVILATYPNLRADIIKIPHHGSRFSSTDQFLEQIDPQIAAIQVGKNLFGHPHNEVLEKLNKNNSYVFRNDENGAIIITIDREKISIKTTLETSLEE